MRGWSLTYWQTLLRDERAQVLAYDELERERRKHLIDEAGQKLNAESLMAWLFQNG